MTKAKQRPIGIDLFAGAGGMSLGFEQAGFDVVAAVEIDPIHACIHKFNFQNSVVIPISVQKLSGDAIRKAAGIGRATVDVVFGGAPCQGFSMIGKRVLDDPRNSLVKDFLRITKEIGAKYFVFENVKGLTLGKHRKFLDEFIEEASSLGYEIHLPWKVLNAKDYGVPQSRERLILFGVRKGLKVPQYPKPLSEIASTPDKTKPKQYLVNCEQALDDLPDAERFDELLTSDEVSWNAWRASSKYAQEMRCATPSAWHYGYKRKWNRNLLTSSMRSDHTPISRSRFAKTAEGDVEPVSRFFKLPRGGIANTLRAGTDAARGAFTSPRPIHYKFARCITVREMARLHGFPDWFRFHETKWHGARQIGNAVPPPLARAVAAEVLRAMGKCPTKTTTEIALGQDNLLRMDLTAAAAFLGVPNPIARRRIKKSSP
jgi:DNA (cytosine-5)-methyltransferase 1